MIKSIHIQKRGAVLVQFAFLVAVLLGIAALASDLGLIRVAQSSMQNAADAAALEGLRWANAVEDNARRQFAKDAIKRTFDLDSKVNFNGSVDQYASEVSGLGAGPVVQVLAASGIHGAGGLVPASIGQYKPNPQPNSQNLEHGDLVAGDFADVWSLPAIENSNYSRNDFAPVAQAESSSARSFLARLRRTPDRLSLDGQAGVSSNGGGVPILFGLGPLTLPNTGADYDVRRDGITVRATAIASAAPALQVGPRTYRNTQTFPASDLAPYGYLVIANQTTTESVFTGSPGYTGYLYGVVTPLINATWWTEWMQQLATVGTPAVADFQIVLIAREDGTTQITASLPVVTAPSGWVMRVSSKDALPQANSVLYMAVENGRSSVLEVGRLLHPDPYPAYYPTFPPTTPPTQAQLNALPIAQKMRYQVDEVLCTPDLAGAGPESGPDERDLVVIGLARDTSTVLGYESAKQVVGFVTFECVETPLYTPRQTAPAFAPAEVRLVLRLRQNYTFPNNASASSRTARVALAADSTLSAAFNAIGASSPFAPVLVR